MSIASFIKLTQRAAGLFAVLLVVLSGMTALAQTAERAPSRESAASKSGLDQGVHVSGYWRIDVRNADGTLAKHVEFENALDGATTLATTLQGGHAAVGGLVIELNATQPGNGICPQQGYICRVVANDQLTATNVCGPQECTGGLTSTDGSSGTITLAGNVTAAFAGTIRYVGTNEILCASGTNAACRIGSNTGGPYAFTSKSLSPALTINAGQIVQISVVLSFS